jgi:hypothetical protein
MAEKKKKKNALLEHDISEELALDLMREMLLYRRFEEKGGRGLRHR